jgi:murein DD-endopeptidase MepM/ murein hydrolase activator NlpD
MRSLPARFAARVLIVWLGFAAAVRAAAPAPTPFEIVWPTPNTAWIERRPIADFLQATVSGDPASGGFGCVRESGAQFHEGIDLKPISRDAAGEPTDKIFAALPGIVRHVSDRPGESNYGRYIVIEHIGVTPAVSTLYAHLRSIAPGIAPGVSVTLGQTIAVMGRSEGGSGIPKERAHLHFEIGLRLTDNFQRWYDRQKFGSPNEHGIWHGYNLVGLDPLDFLEKFRARRVNDLADYFAQMAPAVRVRVATRQRPDFAARYPSLLTRAAPADAATRAGWDIECNSTGLPFRLAPLDATDVLGWRDGEARIMASDDASLAACRGKFLVVTRAGKKSPGKDLETLLEQLFAR